MFTRRTRGTVNCYSCGKLVSVDAPNCANCQVENPGLWGYAHLLHRFKHNYSFADLITWSCLGLYGLTLVADLRGMRTVFPFDLLAPSGASLVLFGATGAYPCFELGRWWTIFTAGWLHGNLFHIGFNLAWIRYLLPWVIDAYGAARMIAIYVFSAATASLLSSSVAHFWPHLPEMLRGAQLSVGASGALFGLFGALVTFGQRTQQRAFKDQIMVYAAVGFFLGFAMSRIDNWGHLGGFLGGYLLTQTPWANPQRSQSLLDITIALSCLAITIASLIASIVHGLLFLSF